MHASELADTSESSLEREQSAGVRVGAGGTEEHRSVELPELEVTGSLDWTEAHL